MEEITTTIPIISPAVIATLWNSDRCRHWYLLQCCTFILPNKKETSLVTTKLNSVKDNRTIDQQLWCNIAEWLWSKMVLLNQFFPNLTQHNNFTALHKEHVNIIFHKVSLYLSVENTSLKIFKGWPSNYMVWHNTQDFLDSTLTTMILFLLLFTVRASKP